MISWWSLIPSQQTDEMGEKGWGLWERWKQVHLLKHFEAPYHKYTTPWHTTPGFCKNLITFSDVNNIICQTKPLIWVHKLFLIKLKVVFQWLFQYQVVEKSKIGKNLTYMKSVLWFSWGVYQLKTPTLPCVCNK